MSKQTKSKLFVYTALMLLMASSMPAMTLNEAIDTALKQSPVFLIKKQKIVQAKEESEQKRGRALGMLIWLEAIQPTISQEHWFLSFRRLHQILW